MRAPDRWRSCRSSEEIVLGRPDDRGGGRVGRGPGEAAHDDDRCRLSGLALHDGSGGSDLIGKARLGHFKLAAKQIGLAAPIDDRGQSGGAKRDADRAAPPRPPETVADYDGEALADALRKLL